MKKKYVTPVATYEAFLANQYVASCYDIKCNGFEGTAYKLPKSKDNILLKNASGCGEVIKGVKLENAPTNNSIIEVNTFFGTYESKTFYWKNTGSNSQTHPYHFTSMLLHNWNESKNTNAS